MPEQSKFDNKSMVFIYSKIKYKDIKYLICHGEKKKYRNNFINSR